MRRFLAARAPLLVLNAVFAFAAIAYPVVAAIGMASWAPGYDPGPPERSAAEIQVVANTVIAIVVEATLFLLWLPAAAVVVRVRGDVRQRPRLGAMVMSASGIGVAAVAIHAVVTVIQCDYFFHCGFGN
ncbi:MAG: hypothetical protein QOE92_352 [Chloroflexota bacterium]|nr:hypothetical protein [Chloroflexota bacterium]